MTEDSIVEHASRGNAVRARKMFGEYGVSCDVRFVGIVAHDRLSLKAADAGEALLPDAERDAPCAGAKPHRVVDVDVIRDAGRLDGAFRATAAALPAPKPRRPQSG